jgi:hypothetical protein
VIKVEYTTKKEGQVNRYTGVSTVQYLDKVQGPVVAIDHFNTDSQSVLVYATGTLSLFNIINNIIIIIIIIINPLLIMTKQGRDSYTGGTCVRRRRCGRCATRRSWGCSGRLSSTPGATGW